MPQDLEEWKPVVGFEGFYEVSSHGRIRRIACGKGTKGLRILNPYLMSIGYRSMQLSKGLGAAKTRKPHYIHRLVAEAFIGKCPDGYTVNHKDGNKQNNHVSNLEYLTRAGNIMHAWRFGLCPRGERNGHAKIGELDVRCIRELKGVVTTRQLGSFFGISGGHIANIQNYKLWKHVA